MWQMHLSYVHEAAEPIVGSPSGAKSGQHLSLALLY